MLPLDTLTNITSVCKQNLRKQSLDLTALDTWLQWIMYYSEVTSKFFYIYSVYKNSQILSLQLSSASCVSQYIDFK